MRGCALVVRCQGAGVMLQAPGQSHSGALRRVGLQCLVIRGVAWDPRVPGGPRALTFRPPAHAGPQWPGPCALLLGVACSASERSVYFYASTVVSTTQHPVQGEDIGVAESAYLVQAVCLSVGRGAGLQVADHPRVLVSGLCSWGTFWAACPPSHVCPSTQGYGHLGCSHSG